jgi:urea-proton symporter
VSVVSFGLIMSAVAVALYYANIDLGYLYLLMGVIISSAVVPGALTLLWNRQSKWAACVSPILGAICSITSWLVTAKISYGTINVRTTGSNMPMLLGNTIALCSPMIFVPILSWLLPDATLYDFMSMKAIQRDDEASTQCSHVDSVEMEREASLLKHNSQVARIAALLMTAFFIVLVPWPLYGSGYLFSKAFFTVWVVIGIGWLFVSFIIVGVYPIYEGRHSIRSMYLKIREHLLTSPPVMPETHQIKQPNDVTPHTDYFEF